MTRIKRGTTTRSKHKKLMKLTSGYQGPQRVRTRKQTFLKAGAHARKGRRLKKRDVRNLWIIRIGAATKQHGLSYSRFISGLKKERIELDRKVIAYLAISEPTVFEELIKRAQTGLGRVAVNA